MADGDDGDNDMRRAMPIFEVRNEDDGVWVDIECPDEGAGSASLHATGVNTSDVTVVAHSPHLVQIRVDVGKAGAPPVAGRVIGQYEFVANSAGTSALYRCKGHGKGAAPVPVPLHPAKAGLPVPAAPPAKAPPAKAPPPAGKAKAKAKAKAKGRPKAKGKGKAKAKAAV